MKKTCVLFITGLVLSSPLFAQGPRIEGTMGCAKLYAKIPLLVPARKTNRVMQYATVLGLGVEKQVLPKLSVGASFHYSYVGLDYIYHVAFNERAINIVEFPSFAVHGKAIFRTTPKYHMYFHASAEYALNYPVKMSSHQMETSTKTLSNFGVGLRSRSQRKIGYLFEVGYWNSGVLAKGGISYELQKQVKQ